MRNYENSTKHLLLIYFVAFKIKIDSNLLSYLLITNDNLLTISINDVIILESLIKSNDFSSFTSLNIDDDFKAKLSTLAGDLKNEALNSNVYDEIFGIIYEKSLFPSTKLARGSNILESCKNFSNMFKQTRIDIDNIK